MKFKLVFTDEAKENLSALEEDPSKKIILKAVKKTLGYLETNLRHPSLKTHKYSSLGGPEGQDVFEAYVQNQTSGAYRVFWYYGPDKQKLSIAAIIPHP